MQRVDVVHILYLQKVVDQSCFLRQERMQAAPIILGSIPGFSRMMHLQPKPKPTAGFEYISSWLEVHSWHVKNIYSVCSSHILFTHIYALLCASIHICIVTCMYTYMLFCNVCICYYMHVYTLLHDLLTHCYVHAIHCYVTISMTRTKGQGRKPPR